MFKNAKSGHVPARVTLRIESNTITYIIIHLICENIILIFFKLPLKDDSESEFQNRPTDNEYFLQIVLYIHTVLCIVVYIAYVSIVIGGPYPNLCDLLS